MASAARILSISHDQSLLGERQNLLQAEGYIVTSAQSVQELLTSFSLNFDLIVVDHDIPHDEKRKLLQELRRRGCDAPVLGLFRAGLRHDGAAHSNDRMLQSIKSILGERVAMTRAEGRNVFLPRRSGERRQGPTRKSERRTQRPVAIVSTRDHGDRRRRDRRSGNDRRLVVNG